MNRPRSRHDASARWIYNPALDLVVGCGAWSAPLLLLSYSPWASSPTWVISFYALALFFNYPHYMSTLYRAYRNEADFRKYRIFTVHITVLVLLTVILSHFRFSLLPWIFTLYLTTSPWHYSGQNYGLFMMFVRRAGAPMEENTRQAIYSAFVLSYAILFLNLHAGASDRLFLSLGIPQLPATIARIVLGVAFVAFSVYGLRGLIRQLGWKAMTPSLVLFSTQILWFLVPGLLVLLKVLSIPQSRYSTGVLAVMHSAQYLWITSYYARREAASERSRWRPLAYFAVLIVGGIALFLPGPWLTSYVFHYDFTASFLIFTALVNLHHFIFDGAIWKLRDGRIAALLLNTQERGLATAGAAPGQVSRAWLWMRSRATVPRAFRIATAIVLLALAGLDLSRYVFVSRADDLATLQTAAALNPFDSSLETRIARKQAEQGNIERADSAYERAIVTNLGDLAPRLAFLKYLIANERFAEADAIAKAALVHWPNDSDLLVNHGILAAKLDHSPEAIASWEKALSVDPSQIYAHLYLADEFDREQKPEAAIPHYTIFLDRIAQAATKNRGQPDPNLVVPALMKLAQCHLRTQHTDQALNLYDLGRNLASRSHQPRLESVASLNEAILVSQAGQVNDALRLYQNALNLDHSTGDYAAEAADWRAYGVFLNERGFDKKQAFACLVQAEKLSPQSAGGATDPSVTNALRLRAQLEQELGQKAGAIQENPEPLLTQALKL